MTAFQKFVEMPLTGRRDSYAPANFVQKLLPIHPDSQARRNQRAAALPASRPRVRPGPRRSMQYVTWLVAQADISQASDDLQWWEGLIAGSAEVLAMTMVTSMASRSA